MPQRKTSKKFRKTIATILVFVMVFQFAPNIVLAINEKTNDSKKLQELEEHIQSEAEKIKEKEAKIIGELENERTLNEKHFLREDGSIVATIFPSNIHYEKDGILIDVDNTLEEVSDTKETLKISEKEVIQEEIQEHNNLHPTQKAYIEEQQINMKNVIAEATDINLAAEKKRETKIYTNKTGNAKITLTNKTRGYNLGTMESEGHTITWRLENSKASEIKIQNTEATVQKSIGYKAEEIEINIPKTSIEYANIQDNINIQYSVEPEKVKENIILKNKEAIDNELKFVYDVGSLKMKLQETKEIIVYKETEDNVIFTIESPFMYDGKLEFSNAIEVILEEENGKYIVTLIPDKNWLNQQSRVYPVTIDPSIITSRYYQDIQDTFIYSSQGNTTKGDAHIIRAGNNSGVPTRSLIKFSLPTLNSGDQVIAAYLNIFSYPKTTEWTPSTRQMQLDVHKITSDWNESTATWSSTNNNYNSKIEDFILYQFDYNNQCKQYNFNITSIAKEWYTTGNNYGVMIKEHTETNNISGNDAYFISADTNVAWYEGRPVAQIIYRNQTGLEDYLSYHEQDLGRAGKVYTNDYNGNLIWLHEDITTPGVRMPVTIKHVYNTNDRDTASRFGKGMRLNIEQTIELVTISGTDYAKYTDEDGTRHYFTKAGNNTYKDEDGLGLELTLNANTGIFTMKDKGDNILRFERRIIAGSYLWQLKEIEDNNGNKVTISFLDTVTDQFIISKVIDGAGQEIIFQYNEYYLSKIIGPDGKIIEYNYGSTGVLDNIKYPDGLKTYYTFSDNLLTSVKGIDNTLVKYEYYAEKTKRVKKILEFASNTVTIGNTIDISYSNNLTTFTDNKGYSYNVTFNDWGQAISIADFGKTGQDLSKAYGKTYEYGVTEGNKNKLILDGQLTKTVNNLILNGSAEYDGEWGFGNWLENHGTVMYTTEEKYKGNRSLKFTSTYTTNIETIAQQIANVSKGKTYTLSAYIKNNGSGTGFMHIYYQNSKEEWIANTIYIDEELNAWKKYSITLEYPNDAQTPLYFVLGIINSAGIVYYDDVLLEEGIIANEYNLIENSKFDYSGDLDKNWMTYNAIPGVDGVTTLASGEKAFKIVGEATKSKYVRQDVISSGQAGDVFSISAWIYAGGARGKNNTVTDLTINIVGNNNESQWISLHCYPSDQWQFVQKEFLTSHAYKKIEVYFCFYNNINEAYITNIALYKDYFGQSYQYDSNGNLVKSQDLAKQNNTFNYDGNDNLIKSTNPKGGTYEYEYDNTHKHRLVKVISGTGVNYNFEYNQYGQAITSKISNGTNQQYIETEAEYSTNGNYLTKLTDEKGNEISYTYNQTTGTLTKVTDSKNTETNYTYDNLNRVSTVSKTANNKNYQNTYTYANDKLNTITHNGFNYSFIYDNFGNKNQVKIGNQVLITNNYVANNGNLNSITYGNGQQVSYTYDKFNRITTQTKAQGTYQYEYDAKSNLAYTKTPEGTITNYTYDLAGRLIQVNDNLHVFTRNYTYDNNSNVNSKKHKLNNTLNEINYTYDVNNRITNVKLNNNTNIVTNYDTLSRISNKQLKVGTNTFTTQYTYENLGNNRTTTSVASITNGTNSISYTYDELGNIETITEGNILKATYHYDELNQLIREDNVELNKTITYTYDQGGNITAKTEYPYTTGELGTGTSTINYSYTNTNWKDQLTSYNGQAITYDAIGNPLTYNGNTYTWQNGRELAGMTNTEEGLSISYNYNDDGIRTSKTVNGVETTYYLEGTRVIYEQKSNNVIYYSYDENGDIVGLKYNGTQYWYIKNLQGDIIGILDNNLNQIVSYKYDSWGKPISITDTDGQEITNQNNIGIINPYRYRSYRYDTETGLYYLQSRYYNPEWGRFLNADNYGGQIGEILTHNIYAYCLNNPISNYDPEGNLAIAIPFILGGIKDFILVTVGLTGGIAIGGIIQDKIQSNTETKTKEKSKVIPKMSHPNQARYYMAKVTHPGADVYLNQPLSLETAKMRLNMGGDIWARTELEAQMLCIAVSGGYTGPTNDNKPLNAMHYHPISYVGRGHVFFGPDKNLKFIYWR